MFPSETVRRIPRAPLPTRNQRVVSEGYMSLKKPIRERARQKQRIAAKAAPTIIATSKVSPLIHNLITQHPNPIDRNLNHIPGLQPNLRITSLPYAFWRAGRDYIARLELTNL